MKKFIFAAILTLISSSALADYDPVTGQYRGPHGIDNGGYMNPNSPYLSNSSRATNFAVIPQYDFNESLRWLIPQIKTEPKSYQSLSRPYGTPRGWGQEVNTGPFWNRVFIFNH